MNELTASVLLILSIVALTIRQEVLFRRTCAALKLWASMQEKASMERERLCRSSYSQELLRGAPGALPISGSAARAEATAGALEESGAGRIVPPGRAADLP